MPEGQIIGLDWLTVIKDVGTIALLFWIVTLFLKGELLTKAAVNKILGEAENRTAKLCAEVSLSIRAAVKDGILEARAIIANGETHNEAQKQPPRRS